MAAEVSFWIFYVNPGSSAIFFLTASISAVKVLNSASSVVFLAFFYSSAGCSSSINSLLLWI
jgi:hypothetical protein